MARLDAPSKTPKHRPVPVVVEGTLERLAIRARMARRLRGMTQEELGHLADVSTSTVRALEAGADGVSLGNFLKVLQALGLLSQVEVLLDARNDPETLAYAERKLKKA